MFQTEGSKIAKKRLKVVRELKKFRGSRMKKVILKRTEKPSKCCIYTFHKRLDERSLQVYKEGFVSIGSCQMAFGTNGQVDAPRRTAQ